MLGQQQKNQGRIEQCDADLEKMLSVQRVAQAAVIELMANRSLRRLATLRSVTARQEVMRMMSSRRAAPHQGSGCVTPPTHEAEYMAATVFPSASAHSALAFGLGPYMTE
jgi:cysteine sulfinate desulfinase/cysteine desulfurase-like protein